LVTLATSFFARILAGVFQPAALVGFTPDLDGSLRPFGRGRAVAPGFPLQGVLLLRDEHVLACSPLVLQSLDRGRSGVSPTGEAGAPTFLRFVADFSPS
jgi:hypothetical protein